MRVLFTSLLVTVVIAVISVASGLAATQDVRPVLSLRVTEPQSVVISGTRFRANERVTLRLVAQGQPMVKVVRTTATGRLSARFAGVQPECEPLSVSAVGSRGSRVLFRQIPPPCGIAIQP
jgi:hypothetical protein